MSDDINIDDKKKSHRSRNAGRKAEKKKAKKAVLDPSEQSARERNPKAFAFNSAVKAERQFRRKQDVDTKKQHLPLVDRQPTEPPPILIAVVGPPKVGKSTVINNLIKLFTKSPLSAIKGPVTIVTGKKRRITIIECNNDINSMIDLAKVADLVLLLCDASFGFEMEIFEFLNICQVHGMPRIMGILTHLDMIKNAKSLKTTKKTLKHRFWTEVYQGAKLFYLSGITHGEYLRNEIKNLGRFISVMKFRPLIWRTTHSYLIADRCEDLTSLELIRQHPKCDRNVSLYGYVRGIPLNRNSMVHIAGFGDLPISDVSHLPDPCPLPDEIKKRALIEKEKLIYAPFSGVGGIVYDKDAVYVELGGSHSHTERNEDDEGTNLVTNLIEIKETLDVKMEHAKFKIFSQGGELTADDIEAQNDCDLDKVESSEMKVLYSKPAHKLENDDLLENELAELRKFGNVEQNEEIVVDHSGRTRRKVVFQLSDEEVAKKYSESDDSSDSEDSDQEIVAEQSQIGQVYTEIKENKDMHVFSKVSQVLQNLDSKKMTSITSDEDIRENDESLLENQQSDVSSIDSDQEMDIDEDITDTSLRWKENLAKKAEDAFLERQKNSKNLMKMVYGVFDAKHLTKLRKDEEEEEAEELGGLFKVLSRAQKMKHMEKDQMDLEESTLNMPWNANVRDWLHADNKGLVQNCFVTGQWKQSEDANELLRLDDEFDDTDECFGDFEDFETGEKFSGKAASGKDENVEQDERSEREARAEKKRKLKAQFDSEYDGDENATFYDDLKASAEKQALLNKSVFEHMPDELRVQIEGYRAGMYVRIEFENVPCEFIDHFNPTYPIVIGAINMGEENIGFVNVKIKKHRWYRRILKTNDPLILSLGWRRFQTMPMFAKIEDDLKCRYLKYTPEHLTCNAFFWGPITPQGTGFLALQSCAGNAETLKHQGFRIAATGAVQELHKSTQVMKKLKLVGHPMKIYKKTAFIKDMFNSCLEVAKFEGARIKTVSGIRGQIKKAVTKPEGVFRATFEDKIQLSDIVFCRTWYKVDVQKFYTPVTTLLLPENEKNTWRGMRTTGEIRREEGIQQQQNVNIENHLYTEIKRQSKVFKPLVIPSKLQESLPYRDKPKYDARDKGKKQQVERIAVIREPKEQKVANMMKMIKANFDHKQEQITAQTKERLAKYRKSIEAIEAKKYNNLKITKKKVFRRKSKMQLAQDRKGKRKGGKSARNEDD